MSQRLGRCSLLLSNSRRKIDLYRLVSNAAVCYRQATALTWLLASKGKRLRDRCEGQVYGSEFERGENNGKWGMKEEIGFQRQFKGPVGAMSARSLKWIPMVGLPFIYSGIPTQLEGKKLDSWRWMSFSRSQYDLMTLMPGKMIRVRNDIDGKRRECGVLVSTKKWVSSKVRRYKRD